MNKTKRKIHIKERIAKTLDLPLDTMCDMTRITLLGDREMLIENYDGIYLYSENEITLTVQKRRLTVMGSNLVITGAFDDRMIIIGTISKVFYSED